MSPAAFLLRVAATTLVLSTVGGALLHAVVVHVPAGHVGVRVDPEQGVLPIDHPPGAHWDVGRNGNWHYLPAGVRTTEFSTGEGPGRLEIRTSDDQTASVGAVARGRLMEGRAWEVVAAGLDASLHDRVRDGVEDVLRTELAVLGSEEWFEVTRQREVMTTARPAIEAALRDLDVELIDLALLEVSFSQEYTRKLQAKQAAVQQARREEAQSAVDRVARELEQLQQEAMTALAERTGDAELTRQRRRREVETALTTARSEAELLATETRAAADRIHAEALADGQRAIAEAQAGAEAERLAALARPGGRAWLARRAAERLQLEKVVLDPTAEGMPNLLDLDALQALLD